MKSLAEHMAFYSSYHRDPRNRLTHFFGVPVIVYAILILMSFGRIPLGGLEISFAAIFVGVMLVYYLSLDWVLGLTMAAIFVPMCWAAQVTAALYFSAKGLGPLPVTLARTAPGQYRAQDATVTFTGQWTLQVVVRSDEFDETSVTFTLGIH